MATKSRATKKKAAQATLQQKNRSCGPMRPVSHQIGEAALNYVQSLFNQMNWSSNRTAEADYGEDLLIKIFDEKTCVSTSTQFLVQVKGRKKLTRKRDRVEVRLKTSDIAAWLKSNLPVLVVVCEVAHSSKIRGYYVWIDDYVCKQYRWLTDPVEFCKRQTRTVKIPYSEVLRKTSSGKLRKYVGRWSSPREAQNKISDHIRGLTQDRLKLHKIRGNDGRFRWDLFALPISYVRTSENEDQVFVRDEQDLLETAGRNVCLLGKPATGKTTTVDRILASPPAGIIPVLLRHVKPEDMVKNAIKIVSHALGISPSHVDCLAENKQLLFVLDSLNECGSKWSKFSDGILSLAKSFKSSRFVVTCRTDDYAMMKSPLEGIERWEISPLSHSAQDDFLASQSRSTKRAVSRAFREQPDLRELCANQFMFLIAVEFIPGLRGAQLRRADLYRKFLDRYLGWLDIKGLEKNRSMEILSKVAFMMRKPPGRETTIKESVFDQLLSRELRPSSAVIDMRIQLRKLGLFERDGQCGLRFFQETLQEYLCANYLLQQRVFPMDFHVGNGLSYDEVTLNSVIVSFYVELAFINRLLNHQYRDTNVWL